MLTDYHSHLLPAMDDGPENVQTSTQMLDMWKAQGVERIIATPHFYRHEEPAEAFLARRERAFSSLAGAGGRPQVLLGSEVRVEKGISEIGQIRGLTLAGSKYILLELPYSTFKEWMITEIYNLMYNFELTPVLAHIDRYMRWYSKNEMSRVLSVRDAVLQINNEALFKRATQKFSLELIRGGFPIVFGSDAHNIGDRPPNAEAAYMVLRSRLKETDYRALLELNEKLIR